MSPGGSEITIPAPGPEPPEGSTCFGCEVVVVIRDGPEVRLKGPGDPELLCRGCQERDRRAEVKARLRQDMAEHNPRLFDALTPSELDGEAS